MAKPSPFPGMDPWLEPRWGSVHPAYINDVRSQVASQLPDDLYSDVESDVYVVDADVRGRLIRPDVGTFKAGGSADDRVPTGGLIALAEPVRVRVRRQTLQLLHVAIREPKRGNRLVTAIELFSPTNKADARGRATYRRKREDYLTGGANVVEIDLLRGGRDLIDVVADDLPANAAEAVYRACVRWPDPETADEADFFAIPLRQRLPSIPVPLRPGDATIAIDLQRPIDAIYTVGRYDLQIDYRSPLDPPLSAGDVVWAAEQIALAAS